MSNYNNNKYVITAAIFTVLVLVNIDTKALSSEDDSAHYPDLLSQNCNTSIIRRKHAALSVDEFGQNNKYSWQGKIYNAHEMVGRDLNVYGKDVKSISNDFNQQKQEFEQKSAPKNGFVSIAKINGRWRFISSDGDSFYSLGVNTVTTKEAASYIDRSDVDFSCLPRPQSPLARYYGNYLSPDFVKQKNPAELVSNKYYNFLEANFHRMFGPNWFNEWKVLTLTQLATWKFNTLGAWSDYRLRNGKIYYTVSISVEGSFKRIHTPNEWWAATPDPYDPDFEVAAERAISIRTADVKNDPMLIGYFVDNEISWGSPHNNQIDAYEIALAIIKNPQQYPSGNHIVSYLSSKYHSIENFMDAWELQNFSTWSDLYRKGIQNPNILSLKVKEDLRKISEIFAERYYYLINKIIKRWDPNHLYLGSRFSSDLYSKEAVVACVKWCDVLSFNYYKSNPLKDQTFSEWMAYDKPTIISEFGMACKCDGYTGSGVPLAENEIERGEYYRSFLDKIFSQSQIVGAHWFQYADQPLSGRTFDGQKFKFGLIDITGSPAHKFTIAVKKENEIIHNVLKNDQ